MRAPSFFVPIPLPPCLHCRLVSRFPQVPELHVPLAGVFRAHGHTVIASAMAPLRGADTLVYGSCDALRSFVDRHTEVVTPIVEELGRKLGMCGWQNCWH